MYFLNRFQAAVFIRFGLMALGGGGSSGSEAVSSKGQVPGVELLWGDGAAQGVSSIMGMASCWWVARVGWAMLLWLAQADRHTRLAGGLVHLRNCLWIRTVRMVRQTSFS